MSVATMVKQAITSWVDGRVLFECKVSAELSGSARLKMAVEAGVKTGADLTRADLTGADLTRADLTGANLTGADLTRADLTGADLTGANLTGADLTRAYLKGAYLGENKIIQGGARSDGWHFALIYSTDKTWRVRAGCRNFALPEAREHWSQPREKPELNVEANLIVDQMIALAKLRGWEVE